MKGGIHLDILALLTLLGGLAAVIKILTSGRGSLKIPGFNVSWGR